MIPVLVTVVEAELPLRVRRREDLSTEPQVAVVLGDAPDGLPLVLRVERRASVDATVRTALGHPSAGSSSGSSAPLDPEVERALTQLEHAVATSARSAGVFEVRGTRLYRTHATVGSLLGDSMLARILGAQSPLVLAEDRYAPSSRPERVTNTAVLAAVSRATSPVTLMKGLATKRHVAVPLRPGPAFLVEDGDGIEPESVEPLRFEDLRPVPSLRFHARGRRETDGSLADLDAYRRAVLENPSVGWSVAASDVGQMIVQLARSLITVHDEGRVHADVKPANTVITATGAVAIDPIGVTIGQVSPGATPGWAAPEQILARAVTPATDVYPLGLMVARLLGAAIYGEERSFLVPIGKGECRRVRMLADQDVFVDPESVGPMSPHTREGWQDFVRQCVEFDPDDRPQAASSFAERLEELLEEEPLEWRLPLAGGPGTLRRDVDVLGALQPSWVVSDFR